MERQRLQSTTSQSMRRTQTRETQCSEGGEKTQPEDTRGDASGVRDQLPPQYSTSGPMPSALSASSGSTSDHSHLTAIWICFLARWIAPETTGAREGHSLTNDHERSRTMTAWVGHGLSLPPFALSATPLTVSQRREEQRGRTCFVGRSHQQEFPAFPRCARSFVHPFTVVVASTSDSRSAVLSNMSIEGGYELMLTSTGYSLLACLARQAG